MIRFWLDVESFKSSAEPCGHRKSANRRAPPKTSTIGRSISLDGMTLNRDDFYHAYNDDESSMDVCDRNDANLNELPSERDNGDGSSDANSMTNLSDIYERNDDDDQLDTLSMDDDGAPKFDENGRKSATGASTHGDEMDCGSNQKMPSSLIVDAIRIFKKYLLNGELTSLVRIPTSILSQISLLLCVQNDDIAKCTEPSDKPLSISSESIPLSAAQLEKKNIASVFDDVQAFVLDYLDQMYIGDFLESPFYYRFCIENTGTNLKITDILYNELALFYFMEFLEIESKRQYLDFWLAAMNFKRQMDTPLAFDEDKETTDTDTIDDDCRTIKETSQNDALILYEKYFSLQATCPLYFTDRVRFHVEEKICSDDGADAIAHCFDLPLVIIERFLSEKFLRPFERSALFYKYLTELKQKMEAMSTKSTHANGIQATAAAATKYSTETHNIAHKKSPQKDYAHRISTKNTLLAMESVKKRSHQRIKSSDMCIDSRQLHDPDLLWRRHSTSGLKFGHVNEMGRYERDYDMSPCDKINSIGSHAAGNIDAQQIIQSTGNKIKQAVRKLVNMPEQCMQEELAWQMAEMIVKDITKVTLQSSNQVPKETF